MEKEMNKAAEESAKQYYIDDGYSPLPNIETASHKSGFIAGAKWMKEQMMNDAVGGVVRHYKTVHWIIPNNDQLNARLVQFQDCDNVRVIIIKEDAL